MNEFRISWAEIRTIIALKKEERPIQFRSGQDKIRISKLSNSMHIDKEYLDVDASKQVINVEKA